ncbi:glutamate-rich protein 3 [Tupaia chinensis]|uniref:glutamate-rich protein 3 n=1 Tax=Tupaia chinensis TaxID=246437 RepID=UPI0003C8F6D7|nr:glutamate-rich protein 3 [Tupaia chinensis]
MSHFHPAGLLAAYNSLTDKHLIGYFNNTRIRRHLLRSGLITRNGRILSEKEYKLNIMKRDHQKYIRECLAQAIFHKVLDMERYNQLEIKKKLETLARKERIQRFKGEHTRRSVENNMPILSPRPPVGPKTSRGHSVLVEEGHSSPLTLTAPRPYTAPGNMQPPTRLQPLPNSHAVGTVSKITSGSRSKTSLLENEAPFPLGGKKAVMKFRNSMGNSQRMNPYQLPNINSYMMPIPPPPPPPSGKITREAKSETWRKRKFRPTTAPNGLEPLFTMDTRRIHKTSVHSNAVITMIYLGKNVHLSYDNPDFRDEIKVYQQHCGGENLCVYKGKLLEKETFQFISKRHHGFPFSLTFFLNGMQVNRLSSCCEYKHRKGSRLGGKRGYFGFVSVERSSPCYKCIIAMGLDKKTPSPKPKREKSTEKREELKKSEGKLRKDREYVIPRRKEIEGNKASASAVFSAQEVKMGDREVRTAVEEMEQKGKPGQDVWEDDQENTLKYEYEEDFEVDEEKQDEKTNEKGQANEQMNGMSKSPLDDEKDSSDPDKESETSSQKVPDATDDVKDEDDGSSKSELEDDKQDIKTALSTSSRSCPYSSGSEDDSTVGEREACDENSTGESVRISSSQELSENDEPGKSHLPSEESLEIEIEDHEITKADEEAQPLPIEENFENIFEEEIEKGTQENTENLSEKSRKHIPKEEKEEDKSKLWERSTAKMKDKRAGLPRVEKGVGRIVTEASSSDRHCYYDAKSDVSGAEEGGELLKKPEIDTPGAPNENLMVEETSTLSSDKQSWQVAQEACMLEKEAMGEEAAPQQEDADTIEEKGEAAGLGEAGAKELLLGDWKPTAEQPALAEQFTETGELPLDTASGAEAEAEGDGGLAREEVSPTGEAAAEESVDPENKPPGAEAPEQQALVQSVLQTDQEAPEGEQGSPKAMGAPEAAVLTEAAMSETGKAGREAAVGQAGPGKPGVEESEEQAAIDQRDRGPMEEPASGEEDGCERTVLGSEDPGKGPEGALGTEAPLSRAAGGPEELCKEAAEREGVLAEAESINNRDDDRKEILPEESDVAGETKKAERPKTPAGETASERDDEVARAKELKDEDALEEQKPDGEEGEAAQAARSEERRASQNQTESAAGGVEAAAQAPESPEDAGLLEEAPPERATAPCEAARGSEPSGPPRSPGGVGAATATQEGAAELASREAGNWGEDAVEEAPEDRRGEWPPGTGAAQDRPTDGVARPEERAPSRDAVPEVAGGAGAPRPEAGVAALAGPSDPGGSAPGLERGGEWGTASPRAGSAGDHLGARAGAGAAGGCGARPSLPAALAMRPEFTGTREDQEREQEQEQEPEPVAPGESERAAASTSEAKA